MVGPIDMNIDMFWEASVGFLESGFATFPEI